MSTQQTKFDGDNEEKVKQDVGTKKKLGERKFLQVGAGPSGQVNTSVLTILI